jgi:hypothetical protein
VIRIMFSEIIIESIIALRYALRAAASPESRSRMRRVKRSMIMGSISIGATLDFLA